MNAGPPSVLSFSAAQAADETGSVPEENESLVAACLAGDQTAWARFFEQFYPPLCRFAFQLSLSFSREDAEEIAQETLLRAARSLGELRPGGSLKAWLFRIAGNAAHDLLDKQNAAKRGGGRIPIPIDSAGDPDGPSVQFADPRATTPSDSLISKERSTEIRAKIDSLADSCRELINLRFFGGLSYGEIATSLKLNEKTVGSRLGRCLERLRLLLTGSEMWSKPPVNPVRTCG